MKKRGFFFVALGLTAATMAYAADQNYTDLGTAQTLEVTEDKLSDAQVNTGSYVTVITREQIENYHAETLRQLLEKAPSVTTYAAGAVGAMATPKVMGATADDTLVFIDGMMVNPYYSTFDMSTVPTAIIDHIEIIKAGSGNTNAVAAGGIINIVTKKAAKNSKNNFELSFENGSYLPKGYTDLSDGSDDNREWKALVDSQKIDATYMTSFDNINLLVNAGGVFAQNKFTYESGSYTYLNEDNGFKDGHANAIVSGTIGNATFRSNNMFSYQDYDWINYGEANHQKTLTFNTSNTVHWNGCNFYGDERYSEIKYKSGSYKDRHQMNRFHIGTDYTFAFTDDVNLKLAGDFTYDKYVDPETDEDQDRFVPKLSASSSIYLAEGKVGLYPLVSASIYSDLDGTNKFTTSDSFGMVWQALDDLDVTANFAYAETVPSYAQLHDPYMGKEDLKTERATTAVIGANYTYDDLLVSKTSVFAKYFDDLIVYVPTSYYTGNYDNIDSSVFFGLEEYLGVTPYSTDNQKLTVWGSYLLNKSYDLSGDYDLGDDEPIKGNRTHLVKLGTDYSWKMLTVTVDVAWNSEPEDTDTDSYLLANFAVTGQVTDQLSLYGAIDNLFDTDYTSQAGYPMPGMKIRLGGTWKF